VALHRGIRKFAGRFHHGRYRRHLRILNPASESSPDLVENRIDGAFFDAGPEKNKKPSGAQWTRDNSQKKTNQNKTLKSKIHQYERHTLSTHSILLCSRQEIGPGESRFEFH
jgi:hypothetical protein